jgi:quercetin dioxygenase-like cupin family protein
MEKSSQQKFISNNDTNREKLSEGIYRTIISYDEKVMMVKVEFEKGCTGTVHHHFHTQITYIEKGVFEVEIDQEKKILHSGSSFYVAPGLPHGVVCLEAGVLIDVFAPMRAGFLK